MASMSLVVRWLEESYEYVKGMVPGLIREAGFIRAEETGHYTTAFGTLVLIRAVKLGRRAGQIERGAGHHECGRRLRNRVMGSALRDRRLAVLFGLAVVANYPWEQAQFHLYVLPGGAEVEWWMCAAASVADGLVVLLIVQIGRLVIGQPDWYLRPGARGYAVLLLSGAVVSTVIEWSTIHVGKWWAYSPRIPLIPVLNIEVAPLVQMLVLPPLIVTLLAWCHWKMMGREPCDG